MWFKTGWIKEYDTPHPDKGSNVPPDEITGLTSVKNHLPDESLACIKELRRLMTMAEQGKLQGFAYAITYTENHDSQDSAWDVGAVGTYRRFPMDGVATTNALRLTLERWALDGTAPDM